MKILLVSDTHGYTASLEDLLKQYTGTVQAVYHMGDHARDLLGFEQKYPELSFAAVAGNTDYDYSLPREKIITITVGEKDNISRRIMLVHGHNHGVKTSTVRLSYYALEKEVDACFFGHTHVPEINMYRSVFMMNPGSLVVPRGGSRASYGIVDISDAGEITGEVICYEN